MESSIWRRGSFTVPVSTSDERVQLVSTKYMVRFGNSLEAQGYRVLKMTNPKVDDGVSAWAFLGPSNLDRKQYVMWALVTRRPVEWTIDVPDEQVHEMEKFGFRLKG